MAEPDTPEKILSLVNCVNSAAKKACDAIDEQDPHGEVKDALRDLRQGVQGLKSDTMMYRVLIATMQNDTSPHGLFSVAIFINTYVICARATHLHS